MFVSRSRAFSQRMDRMSRSDYIYVVLKVFEVRDPEFPFADSEVQIRVELEAAFTVKKELITWWRRQDSTENLTAWRINDIGGERRRSHIPASELEE